MMRKLGLVVVSLAALIAVCVMAGMQLARPAPEVVTPQPAQSLPGGAVVLERKPATKPSKPKKPGANVERDVSVTVQPDQAGSEPVRVDLQLVAEDGGRRVIASSPDGQIVGGLDLPQPATMPQDSRKWAAGLSCDPTNCQRTAGAWIDRDLGRIRLGAELTQQQIRVRAGWTF